MSDNARRIAQLQDEIAAVRNAIAALAALPEMQRPLRDQLAEKEQQLAALQLAGPQATPSAHTHTQQSGGINLGTGNRLGVQGDFVGGDKVGGDKVQGDKITHSGTYDAPPPADTSPDHLRRLIKLHSRRLQVLKEQAARTGYHARPEVVTEIEEIEAEIARLEALLAE